MTPASGLLFDLDDTLYLERRFVLSGFAAVARTIAAESGASTRYVFGTLVRALRSGERGRAFQRLCSALGLPEANAERMVGLFRTHEPNLRLPEETIRTLALLRPDWRLGIVTNGPASIQLRKVLALGLNDLVDTVIYAAQCGGGEGKPAPEPFAIAAQRLGVPPRRCVFVGDHPVCDIFGARNAGMRTIRMRQGIHKAAVLAPDEEADAVADSLRDVPRLAAALLPEVDSVCA